LEIHLEAIFRQDWRCTGRPKLSEIGDPLGGRDRARMEEYLEAVNLEAVVREEGATGAETIVIG
jgi:hypothetical protein